MQGKTDSAKARLNEVEGVMRSLPENYYNNWIYPGTLIFIGRSNLSDEAKIALMGLCKRGAWFTPKEAEEIIAKNRAMLRDASGRIPGPY
jgi:hypothetical protein